MTDETKPISDEDFAKGRREFYARIEQAQSEGNSKLANQIYQEELAWVGKVKGNAPIVGGWGKSGQRTA